MITRSFTITIILVGFLSAGSTVRGANSVEFAKTFLQTHCFDCHGEFTQEGDLHLGELQSTNVTSQNLSTWIRVFDRVSAGEMPPDTEATPDASLVRSFLQTLSAKLKQTEVSHNKRSGRAIQRRLNRHEYENTLRDLLSLPQLAVKESLPEDAIKDGYNKLGEALDVSHVQVARYIDVAEKSLREAIAPQVTTPDLVKKRFHTWKQLGFRQVPSPIMRKTFPLVGLDLQHHLVGGDTEKPGFVMPDLSGSSRPDRIEQEAVSVVVSTYEPTQIQFNNFRAPVSGRYRLRFSGYTIWMSPNYDHVSRGRTREPISIYADLPPAILRKVGQFEWNPEPSVHELTTWLEVGETIRPDAVRLVRSRPPDHLNPLEEEDGMPGVAFQWMDVEGPLVEQWPEAGHQLMFGDLPITDIPRSEDAFEEFVSRMRRKPRHEAEHVLARHLYQRRTYVDVHSDQPKEDAKRLLRRFINRAYRHPVSESEWNRFYDFIVRSLDQGNSFPDAMIAGYTAVLTSPRFLFLHQSPGRLNDHSIAERLAYFLWNSPPDSTLLNLADQGVLLDPSTIESQLDRMLRHPNARRFVDAFLDYWLDLRFMNASGPDAELYPDYQLDDHLVESMREESQRYLLHLLRENATVDHLVDSDYLIINERLADHYHIPGVQGPEFRKVKLAESSPRGGLITQASVLKVTANGTTTSPVTRGVWVMERILGIKTPPPPASVPAIESDIRGATTIREQLALHRSEPTCNRCHQNIDPVGFALENFDVMGGWRDRYRTSNDGMGTAIDGVGHNGLRAKYRLGPEVDPSGTMPDGQEFQGIRDMKQILVSRKTQLARNLTRQWLVYATGAPIGFSDREQVESILEKTEATGYRVQDLLREVVLSELFLTK